jgi:hypothetical protein
MRRPALKEASPLAAPMFPAALYGQLAAAQSFNDPLAQALALAANPGLVSPGHADSNSTTPSGSKDTTLTKIFVGGLPYHTTDQTLHEYFKQFGEIEEAVVITDRQTQKSRGYGFVTMKEKSDAEKACKDPNPIIDGRKANVNLAVLGAKPRNNVTLTALSSGLGSAIPLQQQLAAALMPGRLGLSQLYYPAASVGIPTSTSAATSALLNPLAQLNPQLAAAFQMQQLQAVSQAVQTQAIQQQPQSAQQALQLQQHAANPAASSYLNYATLQALAAQQQSAQQQSPSAADLAAIQQQVSLAALQQQVAAAANSSSSANSLVDRREKGKARVSPY